MNDKEVLTALRRMTATERNEEIHQAAKKAAASIDNKDLYEYVNGPISIMLEGVGEQTALDLVATLVLFLKEQGVWEEWLEKNVKSGDKGEESIAERKRRAKATKRMRRAKRMRRIR